MGILTIRDDLNIAMARNTFGLCFAGILDRKVDGRCGTDRQSNTWGFLFYDDPRALVFSHHVQLAVCDEILRYCDGGQDSSKGDDKPIRESSAVFDVLPRTHPPAWTLLIMGSVCSFIGIICFIVGHWCFFYDDNWVRALIFIALGIVFFSLVFALGHWRYSARSINSSTDHSRSVTPAAIAGVQRSVRCTRTKL